MRIIDALFELEAFVGIDPEYVRQHYAPLTDDALLAVESAQRLRQAYEKEIVRKSLSKAKGQS